MTTLVFLAIFVLTGIGISALVRRFAYPWYDPYERQSAFLEHGRQGPIGLLPAL